MKFLRPMGDFLWEAHSGRIGKDSSFGGGMMKRLFAIGWIPLMLAVFGLLCGCGIPPVQALSGVQDDVSQIVETSVPQGSTVQSEVKGAANAALDVPSTAGALRVRGAQLTSSSGKPVQLRGISTHGLAWFPQYVNENAFRQLRQEWNVNVVRLAMYTAEYGGYCTGGNQQQLKTLVRKGIDAAAKNDMYVILDWHILSDGNPNQYRAQAKEFFREMSAAYAKNNNVLYEICNEPNGSASWKDIKAYAEEIIPVIRANDPDAVIIVGTPNWSQYVDQAAANPIKADNVMYALHFYAATHKDDLRNKMVKAVQGGLPVFVTEFGICDASGNGSIDESQANQWVQAMDRYGVSYVAWNLSNKNETSAILKPSCTKTSGFTTNDLSASGQWVYRTLTNGRAPAAIQPVASSICNLPVSGTSSFSPSVSAGSVKVSATLVNQWNANGQTVRQYSLTLTNPSSAPCQNWSTTLRFKAPISLTNGWNGNYTVSGNTLRITAKDYNATIPAGSSIRDVGFIVSGGEMLPL